MVLATPPRSRREVKVSLFGGLAPGRVGTPEPTDDGVLLVASARDLLATELKVLFDRVEAKDYLDIAALLDHGVRLPQGLSDARTIFGSAFSPSECLRILSWYDEPELTTLTDRCRSTLTGAVSAAWGKPLPSSKKAGSRLVPGR